MNNIFLTRATVGPGVDETASKAIRTHIASMQPGTEAIISIIPQQSIAGIMEVIPLQKLVEDIKSLQKLASTSVDQTDVNAVLDLLNEFSAWLPYAGKVQGCAKYYLLAAEAHAIEDMPEGVARLSVSERRKWAAGKAAEYAMLYEMAERVCAAITHRCDHLRTFVSYEKAQAQMNYASNPK